MGGGREGSIGNYNMIRKISKRVSKIQPNTKYDPQLLGCDDYADNRHASNHDNNIHNLCSNVVTDITILRVRVFQVRLDGLVQHIT